MEVMQGTWTLTAPNGRKWESDHPLKCVRAEINDRVPASTQLERIMAVVDEPDFDERHLQLATFYQAKNVDDLVDKMEEHIRRLQDKTLVPAAKVAEVHMSRYTIEWLGRVWPEGTLLCWALPPRPQEVALQRVREG